MLLGNLYNRPVHSQYRRYWKVIEEFLIYRGMEVSPSSKRAIHMMFKEYVGIGSIARKNILRYRLTQYINQVEMLMAREFGFVLGNRDLKF